MADLMAREDVGGARRVRWTLKALEEALANGSLDPEAKYEVLDGELYEKMGQDWPHAFAIKALMRAFQTLDYTAFDMSVQLPLRVFEDGPEPDFAVVKGAFDARTRHPTSQEALLVVEVAQSSIKRDRSQKARIYADGGVPVYWIVDLNLLRVEVHRLPEQGAYSETRIFDQGETLPPPFEGAPAVEVSSLLAPKSERP